ncbi:MAG: hypothetical protein LBG17_07355 [Bacteroidales bacterium]|jgi:hypothetical protein|nr:hypothetical protein [Bacteroidales bacterium]
MKNILKQTAILLIFAGSLVSCGKEKDEMKEMESKATGSIVGGFCNGPAFLYVQVDYIYPIGGVVDYTGESNYNHLPEKKIYKNLIRVQFDPDGKYSIGDEISFSYRKYNHENDSKLVTCGTGLIHGDSVPLDVPVFIITDYTILK